MVLTAREIQRRYLLLQGLRWLPIGFTAPVFVLILGRSLPLARIGPLLAIYGATAALLELPTGGLADRIGRRPVLLASSLCNVGFFLLLLVSSGFPGLAAGVALGGVGRALDSGPLEAWFVDQSLETDPETELRIGLSRAGVVNGVALSIGSVAGGVLPQLADGRVLAAVVAALVFQIVHLAAVWLLMTEPARASSDGSRDEHQSLRGVISGALGRRTGGRPYLLFAGAATIGVGLVAIESLWQPRFIELLDREDATVFLGVLLAVAFAAGAVGAAVSPRFVRRVDRWSNPAALAHTAVGLCLLGLAAVAWPPAASALFVLFYALLGVVEPQRSELLHREVTAAHRSTALSGDSLSLQLGGFIAALTLPALADANGIPLAWTVAGVALVAGAPFYLRLQATARR